VTEVLTHLPATGLSRRGRASISPLPS
jgi:hypothetical protein